MLIKNWKSILDIGLIVGAIFLIFLWNPFNIFGTGLKLQDTANMVSEIKEIGELITAEYYGEVIATDKLQEVEIEDPTYFEDLATDYYLELKDDLIDKYDLGYEAAEDRAKRKHPNSEKRRTKLFTKEVSKLKAKVISQLIGQFSAGFAGKNEGVWISMVLFASEEHGIDVNTKRFKRKYEKNGFNSSYVKRILNAFLSTEYEQMRRFLDGDPLASNYSVQGFKVPSSFQNFYYTYLEADQKKKNKEELALIGRGSVKAGFKFGKLDERNLVYDETQKKVHFFGFQAEILNQDINPWFIPEAGVPGFDILLAEGKIDFEDMKRVKSNCIKLLKENAIKAGIIEQAQENGQEAMKEFFGLLLDKEINEVVFHNDPLTYQSDQILENGIIEITELETIEELYQKNLQAIEDAIHDKESPTIISRRRKLLTTFLDSLKSVNRVEGLVPGSPFNFYSRHIPVLLADSMITEDEWDLLTSLRHDPFGGVETKVDTLITNQDTTLVEREVVKYEPLPADWMYWFEDSLQYISEYNGFVKSLTESPSFKGFYTKKVAGRELFSDKTDTLKLDQYLNKYLTEIFVNDGDNVILTDTTKVVYTSPFLRPYPVREAITEPGKLWQELIFSDTLHHWYSSKQMSSKYYSLTYSGEKKDSTTAFMDDFVFYSPVLEMLDSWKLSDPTRDSIKALDYKVGVASVWDERFATDYSNIELLVLLDDDELNYWTLEGEAWNEAQPYAIDENILLSAEKAGFIRKGNSIARVSVRKGQDGLFRKYITSEKTWNVDHGDYYVIQNQGGTLRWRKLLLRESLPMAESQTYLIKDKLYLFDQLFYKRPDDRQYQASYSVSPSNDLLEQEGKEIMAIRNYLITKNNEYHNIGPILKLRRRVDQFVTKDANVSDAVEKIRNFGQDFAQSARESMGMN